jgi:hypothetical protein
MRSYFALLILTFSPFTTAHAGAPIVLEQVVPHDPALNVAQARLGVGLDGNIHLGSPHAKGGYVLRVSPDGRILSGGNALATPLPLTPNLLAQTKATVGAVCSPRTHGDPRPWQNKVEALTDGKPEAPPRPWLEWTDIGYINSGWRDRLALEIDTYRTQLHVTAVTLVEEGARPLAPGRGRREAGRRPV